MPSILGRIAAVLAAHFAPKRPIPYEVRTWQGKQVFIHFADSFSEALAWAKCYGPDWGITTIWQGGDFVAAVAQGE